jgi:hypothetical protein
MNFMCRVIGLLLILVLNPFVLAVESLPMVTIDGDKFVAGGKEFKIWGMNIGHGLHLTDRQLDRQAEELAFLGVNMLRLHTLDWTPWIDSRGPNGEPLASGLIAAPDRTTRHYVNQDKFYRFLNKFREKGIYVAITLSVCRFFQPGDVDILKTDDADAKAWVQALTACPGGGFFCKILPAFDERALALQKEYATFVLSMKNPKTGVRLAEDPQLALLNTLNEMSSWVAFYRDTYRYPNIPSYFQNKVIKRWGEFLRTKYATDEKLAAAWQEKGKRGLLPDESLKDVKIKLLPVDVATVPLKKGEIPFSEQRRKDFVAFLFDMDAKYQREMVAHYKSLGWTRPCIYTDTVGIDGETGPMWVKSGLMPYVEDHPYDEANVALFHWGWLRLVQNYGAGFFGPEGPDRPQWGSEINQGNGFVNELRIPFPLFIAAYYSLQGRDGVAWHVWGMKRQQILLIPEWINTQKWADLNVDYPQLYVCRAAGRLFKSCEIKPLLRHDKRLAQIKVDANIQTDEVYRAAGENGCLRVKTEHFRALAAPKDYRFDFGDVALDLTAKTYNVVIVEKLNDKTYEVTAVGKTGGMKPNDPYLRFEPLEFVAGTVTFKNRQIEKIDHIEYPGQIIETVPGKGSAMPFVYGIRLYRVTLK